MCDFFKDFEAFLNYFHTNGNVYIYVGRFERFWGFSNSFSNKWRLFFKWEAFKRFFAEVEAFF
jgi:hypothetical protein